MEKKRSNNFKDKTGQQIGELFIKSYAYTDEKHRAIWQCICSCGNEVFKSTSQLQTLKTCGHLLGTNSRHGRLYNRWYNIKERTTNTDNPGYKDYGKRGITMCSKWLNSFDAFVEDMGIPPKGYSLDRIDNNKGYYKENCRWVDRWAQAANKRNNILVNFKNKKMPLKVACREANLNYKIVHQRMVRQNLNPQENFNWYLQRQIKEWENGK